MSHMNATPEPARRVSARLAAIQESATLAVDAKAKALKAEGRPVIGFGAGEPDFPTPAHIVEVAAAATRDPKNHRYTPAAGLPELRKAIADKTFADSGVEVSPANILVTNGGKQAVYQAFAAITDEPEPEVAAAGHDRTIINIRPEHVDAWLNPDPNNLDALFAIFDDKRHRYYELVKEAA